jgi:hypothetical protein
VTPDNERPAPRVAILADDLIWSGRLVDGVRRAGGSPLPVRAPGPFMDLLGAVGGCVVDLTSRAYDGVAAVTMAARAGVPVIAVGQHDDARLRRAARAAGAARVYAYRTLFEHPDRELGAWIASLTAAPASLSRPDDPVTR